MNEPRVEYEDTKEKSVPSVYGANGERVHKGEPFDNRSNAKRSLRDLLNILENLAARGII